MKNGILITIALAVWGVIKLLFKLLKAVVQVLSSLIVFLGLYIPLFYLVFGIVLLATTSFTFGGTGTDQVLYYIGLGLSCVAAIIISIRNVIVRPISSVFAPLRTYRQDSKATRSEMHHREEYRDNQRDDRGQNAYYDRRDYYESSRRSRYPVDDYAGGYRDEPSNYVDHREMVPSQENYPIRHPYDSRDFSRAPYERDPMELEVEKPLIYYSRRRPGILVKEYSDRFELFEEDSSGRRYVGTEYKDE